MPARKGCVRVAIQMSTPVFQELQKYRDNLNKKEKWVAGYSSYSDVVVTALKLLFASQKS